MNKPVDKNELKKIVDENLLEKVSHGNFGFPVAYYHDSYEWTGNRFIYYHWHNELEFEYALKGPMSFLINNEEVTIKEGEALLVNRNILHKACHDGYRQSSFMCVVFNPNIVYGFYGSDIETKYVSPLLDSGFSYITFKNEGWQKQVIDLIIATENIYKDHKTGFEIEIQIRFQKAWKILFDNIDKKDLRLDNAKNIPSIKKAVEYIYQNFMNDITLDDIAKSAFISKGECCKLFKKYLKITPVAYLQEYRITRSIELLIMGNSSITQIAHSVGFESSNYYAIAFKKNTGISPTEYRKNRLKDMFKAS